MPLGTFLLAFSPLGKHFYIHIFLPLCFLGIFIPSDLTVIFFLLQFQLRPPFSPESDPEVCHAGPVAASVFPEAEGSCTAHSPSIKGTASRLKLTSPEKVIDFHRELSKNHRSHYQVSNLNSLNRFVCIFICIASSYFGKMLYGNIES